MTQNCYITPYIDEYEDGVRTLMELHEMNLPGDQIPPIGGIALVDHDGGLAIVGYIGGYLTYGDNCFVECLVVAEEYKHDGIGLQLATYIADVLRDRGAKYVQWFIERDSDYLIWHKLILGEKTADALTPMYVTGVSLDYMCNKLEELKNDRRQKEV